MSRAEQAERAMEREQDDLDRRYEEGLISSDEHRRASRELQADLRAAYEDDLYDAQQAVRDEWGV